MTTRHKCACIDRGLARCRRPGVAEARHARRKVTSISGEQATSTSGRSACHQAHLAQLRPGVGSRPLIDHRSSWSNNRMASAGAIGLRPSHSWRRSSAWFLDHQSSINVWQTCLNWAVALRQHLGSIAAGARTP